MSARLRFLDETVDVVASYCPVNAAGDSTCDEHVSQDKHIKCSRAARSHSQASDVDNWEHPNHGLFPESECQHEAGVPPNVSSANTVSWPPVVLSPGPALDATPVATPSEERSVDQPVELPSDTDLRLRAILLRYFAEEIGPRFDVCDDEQTFSRLVPQHALTSPTLRSAIMTTAARHLTRLQRYRNSSGLIEWQGHVLPDLTEESAVRFHNECIKELLRLSADAQQVHNENLLAAAIILRTDEEMDGPLRGGEEDTEIFLGMLNVFINAQVLSDSAVPRSPSPRYGTDSHRGHTPTLSPSASQSVPSSSAHNPIIPSSSSPRVPQPTGLRQAAFWAALRQELFTSFMKQRPLNFPLDHCHEYRDLSPTGDVIWADRLIIFCADVLEYCYGTGHCRVSDSPLQHDHARCRWRDLKEYERQLTSALPDTFEPVYWRPPDPEAGEIFPEIWHLHSCHVTGTNHLELARILLAAFDHSRPKLGPTYAASQRELTRTLKGAVLRMCGTARCNGRSPPAFIEALMAIAMCGGYFDDPREQDALLGILRTMRQEHAYPTGKVEKALIESWGHVYYDSTAVYGAFTRCGAESGECSSPQ